MFKKNHLKQKEFFDITFLRKKSNKGIVSKMYFRFPVKRGMTEKRVVTKKWDDR